MKTKLLIFSCLWLTCCSHKKETFFTPAENPLPTLLFTEIRYTPVPLDSILSSCLGELIVYKNQFLFIDKKFCYAYLFDRSGKLIKRCLGKGHSPREIPTDEITGYGINNHDEVIIFSDLLYFVYDSCFTLKYYNTIKTDTRSRHQSKQGNNPFIYGWPYDKFVIHGHDSKLYYTAINKVYNQMTEPYTFFNECFTILQIDAVTGTPEKTLGPYPPMYQKHPLCQIPYCNFDLDPEGNLYISYEADSLIYKFDKNHKNVKTFGWRGKDMDCDYQTLTPQSSIRSIYLQERNTKGYYDQLLYIAPLHWLCRIYQKGDKTKNDGLQLYDQDYRLTADLDIPRGFRIAGYIAPSLYLYKIDEKEGIQLFSFSFNIHP